MNNPNNVRLSNGQVIDIRKQLENCEEEVLLAVESDDNIGICVNCGEQMGGCEPDTRERQCTECEEFTVFGAEELLFYIVS